MICANCEHEQSRHKGGTDGCRKCDLGCTLFEQPEDAEQTRVLTAVAEVCEDQADKARTELAARLGFNGEPAATRALRSVEQERDEARAEARDQQRRRLEVAAELRSACTELELLRGQLAEAYGLVEQIPGRTPIEVLRQLIGDGEDARLELVRVRGQLADVRAAAAEKVRAVLNAAGDTTAAEIYSYDAWTCMTDGGCRSRYTVPDSEHRCGRLTPVRVTITHRAEGAPTA